MGSSLTHYQPGLFFYTTWKHQKTFRFSDVFRGYRKATPGCNGLKGVNSDKTNTQKENFIMKNIYHNQKYIPATKYVTITPPQNIQEKHFWALIF